MTPCLLVADDTGLIKLVRRKDGVILKKFGTQALGRGITHMALAYSNNQSTKQEADTQPLNQSLTQVPTYLITAHSDNSITIFDWANTAIVGQQKLTQPITGLVVLPSGTLTFDEQPTEQSTEDKQSAKQSIIVSCSSKGELTAQPLSNLISQPSDQTAEQTTPPSPAQPVKTWSLDGPISCIAVNSHIPHQIAAAGRENLLRIFDMSTGETVWRAKNLKHDKLNLRPAVDPTCVAFVDSQRVIEGTATRSLRLYDSKQKRMALWNVTSGEHVVTCCAATDKLAFVGDGASTLTVYDLNTHMRIGGYKGGCQGSVRSIAINQDENLIASASMDRYVRVFDITKRNLVQKVYLKQKLNVCMFVVDVADPSLVKEEANGDVKPDVEMENDTAEDQNDDEDVDEDELWGELERRRVKATGKPVNGSTDAAVKVEQTAVKTEEIEDDSDVEDICIKNEQAVEDDGEVMEQDVQIELHQDEDSDSDEVVEVKPEVKSKTSTHSSRQSIKQSTKSASMAEAKQSRKGIVFGRRIGAKKRS